MLSTLTYLGGGRGEGGISTEGEICLCRGRFFYGGGDLSTAGRICLRRGDLSTEGETHLDSSTDGEICLRRVRFIYRGGDVYVGGDLNFEVCIIFKIFEFYSITPIS
jgi:hypothetical protein